MKKLLKVMGVVAVCAAFSFVVYNQVNAKPENPILAKNIEALSQSEGGGIQFQGYKNVTDKSRLTELRVKIDPKTGANIEYEVECIVYKTYCKSASSSKVCYDYLNKTEKICGE